MAEFDWYQGTSECTPEEAVAELHRAFDLSEVTPGRAQHGYLRAAHISRGDEVLARVWWEGNPGTHITGSGEHAPIVARVMRSLGVHRVSRLDAREDWIIPGLFDELAEILLTYAAAKGIKINQQGDWHRGEARTLYLGATQSPAQLVLYEKGYECGGDPSHVRLEVRIRPVKDGKLKAATMTPREAFGATRWLVEVLKHIGWDDLQKQGIGTVWRASDQDRARAALLRQYGATIRDWVQESGSWEEWLHEIRKQVMEAKACEIA